MPLEIKRFLLVGIGSNLINFLVYQMLYYLGLKLFLASLLGYIVGLIISYTLARVWIFGQKFASSRTLVLSFLLVYMVGGIGMSLLIVFLTMILGIDFRISWTIGALFAVVNNFCGQKFFVFKNKG